MSTNFLWRVLVAPAANATKLNAPNKGSNIATITGWTAIGAIDRGDDADLDEDSIDIAYFDEVGEVMPPVALSRVDVVNLRNGVDGFSLVCYDASEDLLELASDISITAHVGKKTLTGVKRSVIIETNGVCYDYFPNVLLNLNTLSGAIAGDGVARTELIARCAKGITVTSGHERVWYQPAA